MEIKLVEKKDFDKLSALDPFGRMYLNYLPGHYCLGACEKDEEDNDLFVGTMFFTLSDEAVVIDWLFVEESMRRRGIGEGFLKLAYEMALKKEKADIMASVFSVERVEKEYPGAIDYLDEHYFGEPDNSTSVLSFSLEETEKILEKLPIGTKEGIKTAALKDLDGEKRKKLYKDRGLDRLYKMEPGGNEAEPACSVVCVKDGVIEGALLVNEAGKELAVTGFMGKDQEVIISLLESFFTACDKKGYPENTVVNMTFHTEKQRKYMEGIFGEGHIETGANLFGDIGTYVSFENESVDLDFGFLDAFLDNLSEETD